MNIGEYSVNNKVISWLLVVIMVGGGLIAFDRMGKLEDPPLPSRRPRYSPCIPVRPPARCRTS